MIKEDYLKNAIRTYFQKFGNTMYQKNADIIKSQINNDGDDILPINVQSIERGKFYFVFYDMQGKSTKMEKFNPLFVIDWNDSDGTRWLYGVSLNFLPVGIRTVFFNTICNHNLKIVEKNISTDIKKQLSFENINFANIYKMLYSIGFEWCIRKFDFRLINKTYIVSTILLPVFITMSTASMTGVDDSKIIDIWQKKITEQEQRHKDMVNKLLGDYKLMEKEFDSTYNNLDIKNQNLEKSIQLINNIF